VANTESSRASRRALRIWAAQPRVLVLAFALVAALTGCGGLTAGSAPKQTEGAPSVPTAKPASQPRPMTVKVFFVKGEQFAPQVRTPAADRFAPTFAVEALLAGPTRAERRAGVETTIPTGTRLVSLSLSGKTATVGLGYTRLEPTAFDVSLRPARAAQIVYTLTAIPQIKQVVIKVNGTERAIFVGSRLALRGALDQRDLSKPITLPSKAIQVPRGAAPADPRGVQERLVALRYLPSGAATGTWDYRTSQAVLAFQAWHRLDRDGIVGAQTLAALETAAAPTPTSTQRGRSVEVYRDKGVTLLVSDGEVVRAIHSSSGTRGYETPAGRYSIFRKELDSWSVPYQVWLPYASYFNGGIAFHAYADVPVSAASHGCIRLPAPDAPAAYDFMTIGTPVLVY
jgi:lipoprotein-anchoring transpeptidase ErfK/SrfK